jgi:hypothetical protein
MSVGGLGEQVQVGACEFDAERLASYGESLTDCLNRLGVAGELKPQDGALPVSGWRILVGLTSDGDGHSGWIGAPAETGWALVCVTGKDDNWAISPWGQEEGVIPSKKQRSSGLQMRIPDSCRHWRVGERPCLMVELVNMGMQEYPALAIEQDTTFVIGSLSSHNIVDPSPKKPGFSYSPLDHRKPVLPGESRMVEVHLLTPDIDGLGPGEYRFTATLLTVDLKLSCTVQIGP